MFSSDSSGAWIPSHFRIQVGSADECVAPGRRQPRETRWTSDGRLSSPETNLKVGLLPLFFMQLLSHMFLSFTVRTSPLTNPQRKGERKNYTSSKFSSILYTAVHRCVMQVIRKTKIVFSTVCSKKKKKKKKKNDPWGFFWTVSNFARANQFFFCLCLKYAFVLLISLSFQIQTGSWEDKFLIFMGKIRGQEAGFFWNRL